MNIIAALLGVTANQAANAAKAAARAQERAAREYSAWLDGMHRTAPKPDPIDARRIKREAEYEARMNARKARA